FFRGGSQAFGGTPMGDAGAAQPQDTDYSGTGGDFDDGGAGDAGGGDFDGGGGGGFDGGGGGFGGGGFWGGALRWGGRGAGGGTLAAAWTFDGPAGCARPSLLQEQIAMLPTFRPVLMLVSWLVLAAAALAGPSGVIDGGALFTPEAIHHADEQIEQIQRLY